MDSQKCHELGKLVEELTTSGSNQLDPQKMKALKKICRQSDMYVEECFHFLWTQLRKDHAEMRLSAFQITDQLFNRSHKFRTLLLDNFQAYLELTLEINVDIPLPPPKAAAESLKNSSYQALRKWHEQFSSGYRKLELAFNYLKNCHKIDFDKAQHVSALEQQRAEQEAKHKEQVNSQRRAKFDAEYGEMSPEIKSSVDQLTNCLKLLSSGQSVFDIFDSNLFMTTTSSDQSESSCNAMKEGGLKLKDNGEKQNNESQMESGQTDARMHGRVNMKSTLQVSLDDKIHVEETTDNTDVIHHLDELKVMFHCDYLPRITRWLSLLQRMGADLDSGQRIKDCMDLKGACISVLKHLDMFCISRQPDDSDDDFMEVDDEFNEVEFFRRRLKMSGVPGDTSSLPSTSKGPLGPAPSTVEYGLDLDYWENPDEMQVPESLPNDAARFWISTDRETSVHSTITEMYRSRRIEFTGTFEPVKWTCRAPLPSGRLCPRMDRKKCPFHGEIIARDLSGKPADGAKLPKHSEKKSKESAPWKDESLLADIKAATGVDLKSTTKASRRHKSNLTNIKKVADTSRRRLESKVLSRQALKRVATAMTSLDHKKAQDRFCHSFTATFSK